MCRIRRLTISLTRYKTARVLPALVDLLSVLPNVHTVEFVHVNSQMSPEIKTAFEGRSFPPIKTLVLPMCAHEFVPCCPAIEEVTCNEGNGSLITSAIQTAHCVNIIKLVGFEFSAVTLKRTSSEGIYTNNLHSLTWKTQESLTQPPSCKLSVRRLHLCESHLSFTQNLTIDMQHTPRNLFVFCPASKH